MNAFRRQFDDAIVDGSINEISAIELISAFKVADMRLRLAIEQDNDGDIGQFGDEVDRLVDAMLAFETGHSQERTALLRFLVDRFVLRDDCGTEMRRAVCDKLLALV